MLQRTLNGIPIADIAWFNVAAFVYLHVSALMALYAILQGQITLNGFIFGKYTKKSAVNDAAMVEWQTLNRQCILFPPLYAACIVHKPRAPHHTCIAQIYTHIA